MVVNGPLKVIVTVSSTESLLLQRLIEKYGQTRLRYLEGH